MLLTGLIPCTPLYNSPFINSSYCKLNSAPFNVKFDALPPQKTSNFKYPDSYLGSKSQINNGFHNLSVINEGVDISECIYILNRIISDRSFNGCNSVCRQVHAYFVKSGVIKFDSFVGNKLVVAYSKDVEFLDDARKVFDEIPKIKVPAFAGLIGGLCRVEKWVELFDVFRVMVNDGFLPDRFLVPTVLKACSVMKEGKVGKMVHGYVIRMGIGEDVFVGNALVDMYANCRDLRLAESVFDTMVVRDVVSWTALVVAYMAHGLVDEAMSAFCRMELDGVQADLICWNAIISGLAQNGEIEVALQTIEEMLRNGLTPKVNTWNGLISGCIQNGYYEDVLDSYVKLFWSSLSPNVVTIVSILPACSGLKDLNLGKAIHGHAIKLGLCGDAHVEGSLIGLYWKCGQMEYAENVFVRLKHKSTPACNEMIAAYTSGGNAEAALRLFNSMKDIGPKPDEITYNTMLGAYVREGKMNEVNKMLSEMSKTGLVPNVVTFNILISGYQQSGYSHEALRFFQVMQTLDSDSSLPQLITRAILPNPVTVTSALSACAELGLWNCGKELHGYVVRKGLESNIFVSGALVDMYSKCCDLDSAKEVFWRTKDRNTVLWNTLIMGYINSGKIREAFLLFDRMLDEGFEPSPVTFMILLSACGEIGALRSGREMHGYLLKARFNDFDMFLASALIDMYAKCGSIWEAKQVFNTETAKDTAVWNSMISSFSAHGMTEKAIELFSEMEVSGSVPDGRTFIALLSACARDGLVHEGWKYFHLMKDTYGISPSLEHCTCMVGIMGTAGLLDEALEFIGEMPFDPDACTWATLLKASRTYSDPSTGERAAAALFKLEPDNASNYIMLSNIYAAAGFWDLSQGLRSFIKGFRSRNVKECSCITVDSTMHAFERGMNGSPMLDIANNMWHKLADEMRCAGHPVQDPVLEEKGLDQFSCLHTEKLAICLGIGSLSPSKPIRVSKNMRMCIDCHMSAKLISNIVQREIFVKDASFCHHMKNGVCSCHDRW